MSDSNDSIADMCRKLRAVIRVQVLKCPQDVAAVSVVYEDDALRITIPYRDFDRSRLRDLLTKLDADLSLWDGLETADEFKIVCKCGDLEELKAAIDKEYDLDYYRPYSLDEIKSYVESRWDLPEWKVEIALEDLDEKSFNELRRDSRVEARQNIVFALVSDKRTLQECDWAEKSLAAILRKYAFSLLGHPRQCSRTEYAVAYLYRVPYSRFSCLVKSTHIYDCERTDDLGEVPQSCAKQGLTTVVGVEW